MLQLVNGVFYTTYIKKEGLPYFFCIQCELEHQLSNLNNTEGYNGYQQIVDSFRLG